MGQTIRDLSFDHCSAYGSAKWCAATLGKSDNWFKVNRLKLEGDGFPKVDRLIGHTLKDDVKDWLATRRKTKNRVIETETDDLGVMLDGI